jgi:oligopeptide/dipeptide ABC transporter ATP-binding protein
MYRGQVVEIGRRDDIFDRPRHPYSCSLLNAVPELGGDSASGYRLIQHAIAAPTPPAGWAVDQRYRGRADARPQLVEVGPGHFAAFSAG